MPDDASLHPHGAGRGLRRLSATGLGLGALFAACSPARVPPRQAEFDDVTAIETAKACVSPPRHDGRGYNGCPLDLYSARAVRRGQPTSSGGWDDSKFGGWEVHFDEVLVGECEKKLVGWEIGLTVWVSPERRCTIVDAIG